MSGAAGSQGAAGAPGAEHCEDSPAARPADAPAPRGDEAQGPRAAGRRRRRVATFVSEVDQRLIDRGIAPSWEDRVSDADIRPGSMRDSPDRGDGANDRRLLDNVPPHAQARA